MNTINQTANRLLEEINKNGFDNEEVQENILFFLQELSG